MNTSLILSRIKTKEELEKLKSEIDLMLDSFYEEKGISFASAIKTKVRAWVSDIFIEELGQKGTNVREELLSLKKEIEEFETLTLILAFEPSESTQETIIAFVRKNIEPKIVLEILYDSSIMGGVIVIYKGIYKDYSFKKVFNSEFPKIKLDLFRMIAR